jgi:methionyl-tRNA formyltransferase
MAKGIDDGDIYMQQPLSLKGDIQDIFKRMVISGSKITKQFLVDHKNKAIRFTPQKALETNPPLKRRRPEDSVFSLEQLSKLPYTYVYNCVRALSSPYPNMKIIVNGVGISVQKIQKCSRIPPNTVPLHENWRKLELKGQKTPLYTRLKDGCAKLISTA